MDEYQKNNLAFAVVVVTMVLVLCIASYYAITYEPKNEKEYNACSELKLIYDDLSINKCVKYLESNANATKKELLENVKIIINEEWLNQPVLKKQNDELMTVDHCIKIGEDSILYVSKCVSYIENNENATVDETLNYVKKLKNQFGQ